jgi:hypothetical protein
MLVLKELAYISVYADVIYFTSQVEFHNKDVANFLEKYNDLYRSATILMPSDGIDEPVARNWAV